MLSSELQNDFVKIKREQVSFLEHKSVMVTGSTGLVGSLICRFLLYCNSTYHMDIRVIAVARNISKAKQILNGWDASRLLSIVKCDFVKDQLSYSGHVDFMVHAAAITNSKQMITTPVNVILTSVFGTRQMLDLAVTNNAKLVYLSSMEVYGTMQSGKAVDEQTLGTIDLSSVRSCYPESKRLCESLCVSYAKQYLAKCCVARLAQTFGAGILPSENRAFAQFTRNVLSGKDIILKTDGLSEANYVYSTDVLSAILILLERGKVPEIYNVSNMETHRKIIDVAHLVVDSLDSDGTSHVVIKKDESNSNGYAPDVKLFLDSTKLQKLGWKPMVSLKQSFLNLSAYMKEQEML